LSDIATAGTWDLHGAIEDIGGLTCGGYYNVDIEDSHGNLLKLVQSTNGKPSKRAADVCLATYSATVSRKDGYIVSVDQDSAFSRQPISAAALDKNGGTLPELVGVR
jgi:hypothetical protein